MKETSQLKSTDTEEAQQDGPGDCPPGIDCSKYKLTKTDDNGSEWYSPIRTDHHLEDELEYTREGKIIKHDVYGKNMSDGADYIWIFIASEGHAGKPFEDQMRGDPSLVPSKGDLDKPVTKTVLASNQPSPVAQQGCPPGTPCESLANKASDIIDPVGLVLDGVLVTAFNADGQVMKMQSGQKLVFHDKRIIEILTKSGAAGKAITIGTVLGKVGTGLGYAGIGLTWIQVGTGEKHWIQGTMDTAMGVVGMAFPGPGTVVSAFYFVMTMDFSGPQIYRDPRIVPMDNTYVAPSYKSMLYKTGN